MGGWDFELLDGGRYSSLYARHAPDHSTNQGSARWGPEPLSELSRAPSCCGPQYWTWRVQKQEWRWDMIKTHMGGGVASLFIISGDLHYIQL